MRKLVCIVGQAGAACEGGGPRLASVCLLTARLSRSFSLLPSVPFHSVFRARFSPPPLWLLPPLCLWATYVCPIPLSLPFALPTPFPPSPGFLHPALCVVRSSSSFFSSLFIFSFFPFLLFSPLRQETGPPPRFPIGRLKERIVNRRMSRGFRNGDCSVRRFPPGVAGACTRAREQISDELQDGTCCSRNATISN